MGKRTSTIAVLLALTFLGSLLALAVVGGVRPVRVTPALGPADPLLPDLEGPSVDAGPVDPEPGRTESSNRSTPPDDAAVTSTGSPPDASTDSAIEPGDQVAVEPPPVQPPEVVPPTVVPPPVVPPELPAPPTVASTDDDLTVGGSAPKNGSAGKGNSKGSVKEKTKPSKKKNGSNGKGNDQSSHENGGTNGSSGHVDQPHQDDDDDGHGSDGD
jgi:hypothetical protein